MSGRPIIPGLRRSTQRRGLTLLELLLALGLIVVIMGGVFAWYLTIQKTRKSSIDSLRDVLMMRALLEQVANEVRHATDLVPGDGIGFSGDENRIVIVRLAMPEVPWEPYEPMRVDLPPPIVDLRRTTYELAWDEELKDEQDNPICHGLVRNDQKTFDPNPRFVVQVDATDQSTEDGEIQDDSTPVTDTELFAPEIKYLKFEYFDGAEWRDRWQTQVAAQAGDGGAMPSGEEIPEAPEGGGAAPAGGEGGEGAGGAGAGRGAEAGAGPGGEAGAGASGGGAEGGSGAGRSGGGGSAGGGSGGGYALPQAIRITIGKIPEPPEDLELDAEQLKEMKERREKEYHEDRFTAVVYLRQADQTLLSSRKHGVDNDLQMGEQTEGQ